MLRNTLANDYPENRFEFREEYWLQAQALIESHERKRKRRAVLWIMSALLIASGVLFYYYDRDSSGQPTPATEPQPAVLPSESLPMARTTPEMSPAPTQNAIEPVKNNLYSIDSKENSREYNPASVSKSNPIPATISKSNPNPALSTGASQKTALQQSVHSDSHIEVTQPLSTTSPDSEQSLAIKPQLPHELSFIDAPGIPADIKSISQESVPVIIVSLPDQRKAISAAPLTEVHHQRRINIGGMMALGTRSGIFKDEQPTVAAGMTARYSMNERWSLNADLNWRRWKGTGVSGLLSSNNPALEYIGVFNEDVVRTYSFGYNQTRTTTTLRSIHFVELPVYIERHFHRFSAEAGVQIACIAFTKSAINQYQSQSLDMAELKTLSASDFSTNQDKYLKSLIPGLLAGVNYQPSKHWSIGVRGSWKAAENAYSANFDSYAAFETSRLLKSLTAELRLRWLF